MIVFSSLQASEREGFRWLEYRAELRLHVVVRSVRRPDGLPVHRETDARRSLGV